MTEALSNFFLVIPAAGLPLFATSMKRLAGKAA